MRSRRAERRVGIPPARGRSAERLEELQAIAVAVVAVKAPHAREVVVERHIVASRTKSRSPSVEIVDQQARMGLSCRAEVLLDTYVQFDAVTPEPASTAGGQDGWLGDLLQTEHTTVETSQQILTTGRAGQLYVVNHEALSLFTINIGDLVYALNLLICLR